MDRRLPLGLRGRVTIVPHPVAGELQTRLAVTTRNAATMVVAGHRGTGRRIALATALAAQPLPYLFVDMPAAPTENRLLAVLGEAILGNRDDYDLRDMQDDLVDALARQSSILVITESQELTTKAASQLQYLHSRPGTPWSLILVGGHDVARASTTSARLRGDILTTLDVPPLKGKEFERALKGMHQSFNISDIRLLRLINQEYCFGLLGRWGLFLQLALDLAGALDPDSPAPTIDYDLARAVTGLMPPHPKPRT